MNNDIHGVDDSPLRLPPELAGLLSRSISERHNAVLELEKRGGKLSLIGIRAALTDPASLVRAEAADALGTVARASDRRRLVAMLRDPDWTVRTSAIESLGYLKAKIAIRPLEHLLINDEKAIVRNYAAVALADVGSERSIRLLEYVNQTTTDETILTGVRYALYRLAGFQYLPSLLDLLDSDYFLVRYQVCNLVQEGMRDEDLDHVTLRLRARICLESNEGVIKSLSDTLDRLSVQEHGVKSTKLEMSQQQSCDSHEVR